MSIRYSPFGKDLNEIEETDLGLLREVSEGWYVEYKSEAKPISDCAKTLSSFANQYGGWLFIGVKETNDGSSLAEAFPGVPVEQVPMILDRLRDASRDKVHPDIYYEHRVFSGPITELQLLEGYAIIAVAVPMGADPPYIHASGRIYRRLADCSAPVEEVDRSTIDTLWNRGEKARSKLSRLLSRLPEVSKGESENPFLHLFISIDPLERSGKFFLRDWPIISEMMKGEPIPFDTIYSRAGGFVARQTTNNPLHHRLLTWEYYREGHAFITIPMNYMGFDISPTSLTEWLSGYQHSDEFIDLLTRKRLTSGRILDLTPMMSILAAITSRFRSLMNTEELCGPFYAKAHLENVWRCTPFLDTSGYLWQLNSDGVPIVQDTNIMCPPGDSLDSLQVLPVVTGESRSSSETIVTDSLLLSVPVLLALGVSQPTFSSRVEELLNSEERAIAVQRRRSIDRSSSSRFR